MDSEAAIRLAEAGGDIMQVSMPIGANVAQWNVALARAAESLGQAGPSATVADAGAVRAALAPTPREERVRQTRKLSPAHLRLAPAPDKHQHVLKWGRRW